MTNPLICIFFFLGKTKLAIWIYDEIKKVVHNKSSNGHVRQKRNWFIFLRQHQRDRIITIFLEVVHPTVSKAGQDKMQPHEFHTASYVQCYSIYIRTVSSLRLLSNFLIQFKLVYGPVGQSNMHNTLDFCPGPARKEMNVPLHKKS